MMTKLLTTALLARITLSVVAIAAPSSASPTPLTRAHSHNDYEHTRPLLDALEQGFGSVEADIHLVEGKLLVAHDRDQVRPERTLQSLYLDPLRERTVKNGGRVYPGGPPIILLIDAKTEAASTYIALREVLKEYSSMLTRFSARGIETNAVTVIVSGNRARELMAGEAVRYAAMDGRPVDLEGAAPAELIPLISEDWTKLFKWRGVGSLSEPERERLRSLVQRAHQQGRKIRFWGAVDQPPVWKELRNAGVDLLNTDDLVGLRQFLTTPVE